MSKPMSFSEPCSFDPEDEVRIAINEEEVPGRVGVAVFVEVEPGEARQCTIFLKPGGARRTAAALLNAADALEGLNNVDRLGLDYDGMPE